MLTVVSSLCEDEAHTSQCICSCSYWQRSLTFVLNTLCYWTTSFTWEVRDSHLTQCVIGPHKCTCQMASKSVKRFKQRARMWLATDSSRAILPKSEAIHHVKQCGLVKCCILELQKLTINDVINSYRFLMINKILIVKFSIKVTPLWTQYKVDKYDRYLIIDNHFLRRMWLDKTKHLGPTNVTSSAQSAGRYVTHSRTTDTDRHT